MLPTTRNILIADITVFYCEVYKLTLKNFIRLNIGHQANINGFDLFLEWIINECLTEIYNVEVIRHFRQDEHKVIFTEHKEKIKELLFTYVLSEQMNDIKHTQIRTIVNGRDLFIVKRYFLNLESTR